MEIVNIISGLITIVATIVTLVLTLLKINPNRSDNSIDNSFKFKNKQLTVNKHTSNTYINYNQPETRANSTSDKDKVYCLSLEDKEGFLIAMAIISPVILLLLEKHKWIIIILSLFVFLLTFRSIIISTCDFTAKRHLGIVLCVALISLITASLNLVAPADYNALMDILRERNFFELFNMSKDWFLPVTYSILKILSLSLYVTLVVSTIKSYRKSETLQKPTPVITTILVSVAYFILSSGLLAYILNFVFELLKSDYTKLFY